MSPKRWILLLVFYISYLMFGASIYYHIEHNLEKQQRATDLKDRIEINEYLLEQLADRNATIQTEVLDKISDYCGKPVTDYTQDEFEVPYTWTFYHSFFFAFTVCSTVGYGNISPTSTLGRMIMIVYSVIGIPINGILFAGLGEYFGRIFEAIYQRYKKYKLSHDVHYVPRKLGLITIVTIALVPGITLFLVLPSWVFCYFENWPFSLAFYYSYVTTTTIGFGDYVPTFQPNQPRDFGGWFIVYELFVIVWFIFSLAYLLMIMTFITRGLQSKKLARLEQQLSQNIKQTQNRIWNGVTKDVGYLRRILNELYILKVKPVYTEQDFAQYLYRSNSCPELSMYREQPPPAYSRKRAYSECYNTVKAREQSGPMPLVHASSDTELSKFDRQKSFQNAEAYRQTTGLLAKVVTALANVKPAADEMTTLDTTSMYGGYHGFSDSEILASEWSLNGVNERFEQVRPRARACSDFNINTSWKLQNPSVEPNEWTWSGDNDKIQEAINNRQQLSNRDSMYRASFGRAPQDYVVNVTDDELKLPPPQKKFSIPDGLRKIFKRRPSQPLPTANDKRKFSIVSVPETQHPAPPLNYYSTVTANASPSYFQNGKTSLTTISTNFFPSDTSISSRLSTSSGRHVKLHDSAHMLNAATANGQSYQRNAAVNARKRRESIFTQRPPAGRRTSMFPMNSAANLYQRRGSLYPPAAMSTAPASQQRRGSLFPNIPNRLPFTSAERRPSMFSATSEDDMDVLESTTLADLIRALEVVHTQAVLDEAATNSQNNTYTSSFGDLLKNEKRSRRKTDATALDPPSMPLLLSLFGGDNSKTLTATAANRLYSRRSTVVGTLPTASPNPSSMQQPVSGARKSSRARKISVQITTPLPSDKEPRPTPAKAHESTVSKFKRRFSIRPTALQIPPGQAPPPGASLNTVAQQSSSIPSSGPSTSSVPANISQTALQRRLSLRPSPLARETNNNTTTTPTQSAISSTNTTTSTARLLPFATGSSAAPRPSTTSSSTHSPLSRIVQISQAQRKSSMPENFTLDRAKK